MYRSELRAAGAIASIFFLRMLGLFMLLPVLALYANHLEGANELLIGIALGVYGLTQASLQIPMGRWSDRWGRKPVIAAGLLVFSAGGALAAATSHVLFVIAGRALQGAGAISGASLALAADLTRAEQRTKVMAIIGITIGMSFSVAFVLGPVINAWLGLSGLFWVAGALGLAAQPILWFAVPECPRGAEPLAVPGGASAHTRTSRELRALQVGVFCLHGILAASFVAIPLELSVGAGIGSEAHYEIYIPVLLASMVFVAPMIMVSHRPRIDVLLYRGAIACIVIGELGLLVAPARPVAIGIALTAFFVGFNFLEASLPSMASRLAPESRRGAALGTYSTAQFIGIFAGGLCGGAISGSLGYSAVFVVMAVVAAAWLLHTFIVGAGSRQSRAADTDPPLG